MLPETAAPWFPQSASSATYTETQIKQQWWSQIFNAATFQNFPLLKAVVYFEESKADVAGTTRDYRILNNPVVASQLRTDLSAFSNLLFAQQISFKCGGQVVVRQ